MNEQIRKGLTFTNILSALFVTILAFLALQIYSMPDKFVGIERYLNDQIRIREQYSTDQERLNNSICEIQKDIKEILKRLK